MKPPQLRALVDQFVADLQAAIRQEALEAVQGALGDAAAPARRGPGRPSKAAGRGPGRPRKASKRGPGRPRKVVGRKAGRRSGRRSPEDVAALGETVLGHVQTNPGQRLEEIGRELRMPTKELKRPISNLMETGALRTEGQKRGTKYFPGKRSRGKAARARKK